MGTLGSSEKNFKNSTVNGDSNPEFCDAEAAVLLQLRFEIN